MILLIDTHTYTHIHNLVIFATSHLLELYEVSAKGEKHNFGFQFSSFLLYLKKRKAGDFG